VIIANIKQLSYIRQYIFGARPFTPSTGHSILSCVRNIALPCSFGLASNSTKWLIYQPAAAAARFYWCRILEA
jgi:hypothetical protein